MANTTALRHEELTLDKENKRKSTRISIGIHIGILLLAFLVKCNHEKAVDNQYSVAINFEEIVPPEPEKLDEFKESANSNKAQEAEGAPRKDADQPAKIDEIKQEVIETKKPEIKTPKPTPTPPTPTEPVISETVMEEESEVTAAEEVIEIDEPELEPVPDPKPSRKPIPDPDPAPPEAKKSTRDKISSILDKLSKKGGTTTNEKPKGDPSRSKGNDTGTGEGTKGDGKGADKSGSDGDSGQGTGGPGVGRMDGSGRGVFGREVVYRNITGVLNAGDFENQEGKKIVFKICIKPDGNVSYVEYLDVESTASVSNSKLKKVIPEIKKYRYEPDVTAPGEECGKLSIKLENINAFGF